jgi:O-antigen ligase
MGAVLLAIAEPARVAAGVNWLPRELHGGAGRFTTHLVIVAPLVACLLHETPLGFGRRPALAVVALGVLFFAAFTSGNRIVWIAFLVEFSVIAVLARSSAAQAPRRAVLATGFGALLLALFALSIVQKAEDVYPEATNAGESLAMDLRPKLWGLAVDAVADRPLLGHGFGHEILADRFRAGIGARGYEFASHGHNMFLNAAVSLGAAGLAILVAMFAALALAYRRLLAGPSTRFLGALGLAILAAFVAKNLTDDFFVRHNALVFWAVNGMLLGLGQRLEAPREP